MKGAVELGKIIMLGWIGLAVLAALYLGYEWFVGTVWPWVQTPAGIGVLVGGAGFLCLAVWRRRQWVLKQRRITLERKEQIVARINADFKAEIDRRQREKLLAEEATRHSALWHVTKGRIGR